MLAIFLQVLIVILLGVLFAYLYGFIEHGYIPPAEHLSLRFFKHFANYHIIMFGLFSALPLVVLVFEPNRLGILLSFGLWAFLPVGEDISWYHFAGTWPTPEDWTSWGGGYYIRKRWVPRWYVTNLVLSGLFFGLALALPLFQ
ncbi:MAG: hypothetical protein ABSC50_11480 [Candidatus Bathyarchaeia archaeon]